MDVLDELAAVGERRRALDALELSLIESARAEGVPWSRIAPALGVATRQAAEQRFLRLSGSVGRDPAVVRRQRIVDAVGGPAVVALRRAVRQALADADLGGSARRAPLARATLSAAVSAPPGAMFSLVEAALGDLSEVDRPVVAALRSAWEAARP